MSSKVDISFQKGRHSSTWKDWNLWLHDCTQHCDNIKLWWKKAGILPLGKTVICDYMIAPSTVTISNCNGKDFSKGSQTQNSQNKPNDATEKELVPTANNFLITEQLVRPLKKTHIQRNTKQIVSNGGKDISNDKFYEEMKEKEKEKKNVREKHGKNTRAMTESTTKQEIETMWKW